jgi:hypothetical protein
MATWGDPNINPAIDFVGRVVLLPPNVTDGPAVSPISYEEMFRRVLSMGAIGVIYGNPYSKIPGGTETLGDEREHEEFRGKFLCEMGQVDSYVLGILGISIGPNLTIELNVGGSLSYNGQRMPSHFRLRVLWSRSAYFTRHRTQRVANH